MAKTLESPEGLYPELVRYDSGVPCVEIRDEFGHYTGFDPTPEQIGAAVADTQLDETLTPAQKYAVVARVTVATLARQDELLTLGEIDVFANEPEIATVLRDGAIGRPWRGTMRTTHNELMTQGEQ